MLCCLEDIRAGSRNKPSYKKNELHVNSTSNTFPREYKNFD